MSDLNTFLEFLEACRDPIFSGNPVSAVRRLLHEIPKMSPIERRMAFNVLQEGISAKRAEWTPAQRATVRAKIKQHREARGWGSQRRDLLAALDRVPTRGESNRYAGRAYLLAIRSHPLIGEFGVTHPLDVSAHPGGGVLRLEHVADDDAEFLGFYQGVRAAQQYLIRHGMGTLGTRVLVPSYSVTGVLPGRSREEPISGSSLGLASAMAALSAFLNLWIPDEVAFTGHVDLRERIAGVQGIKLKLEAARDNGMRRVYVPLANQSEAAPVEAADFKIVAVATLDEVVSSVWSADLRADALDHLQGALAGFMPRPTAFEMPEPGPNGRRILLSWVGKADPTGPYLDQHRKPTQMTGTEEGPILTACRILQPAMVYLFHTTTPEHNNHSDHAKRVEAMLAEILPDCTVSRHPMPAIADPSDYRLVLPNLREEVRRAVEHTSQARPEFFVNLSSGTCQVETTWHLLKEWRIIPGARLLQVREERFTGDGESRVREVRLTDYV